MKKLLIAMFFIIPAVSFAALDRYPSLKYQVDQIENPAIDKPKALKSLESLLASTPAESELAMKMILQEAYFDKYRTLSDANFKIDGLDKEWKNVPDVATDPKEDVANPNGDLREVSYYMSADYTLYVRMKGQAKPKKSEGEESFIIKVFYPMSDVKILDIGFGWDGNYSWVNYYEGEEKTEVKIDFQSAVKDIGEAKIPIGKILDKLGMKRPEYVIVYGGIYHQGNDPAYDYNGEIRMSPKKTNYALDLLLYLLTKDASANGDNIAYALALANSYIYALAEEPTRALIRDDIVKHFALYKKIVEWQKTLDISLDLQNAPLIPKINWAYRAYSLPWKLRGLKKDDYLEFVDTIANLEELHKMVKEKNLVSAQSVHGIAGNIEEWVHGVRTYRSSMENLEDFCQRGMISEEFLAQAQQEYDNGEYMTTYKGVERRWDGFNWVNYQMEVFRKKGIFKGDCGTTTTMQMGMYRGAGICPISLQYETPGTAANTHNFPGYYHPYFKRWMVWQIPNFDDHPLYFYFTKPVWHHQNYIYDPHWIGNAFEFPYYPGELGTTATIAKMLRFGISTKQYDGIFLSFDTMKKGLFLNKDSVPAKIADSDKDGIYDELEKTLGLNPKNTDSDSDGIADLWDLEHRNITPRDGYAIDGLTGFESKMAGVTTGVSEKGDARAKKNFFDIKAINAKIVGDTLYISLSYYNDIQGNTNSVYSFGVTVIGDKQEKYWIQWCGKWSEAYLLPETGDGEWKKLGMNSMPQVAITETEFAIPMKLFKTKGFESAKTMVIQGYCNGWFDGEDHIIDDSFQTDSYRAEEDRLFGFEGESEGHRGSEGRCEENQVSAGYKKRRIGLGR